MLVSVTQVCLSCSVAVCVTGIEPRSPVLEADSLPSEPSRQPTTFFKDANTETVAAGPAELD